VLGEVPDFFHVERFSVKVERRYNALGELTTVAEAVVKARIGDEVTLSAAEGNGPVNALDLALRKDLGPLPAPHRGPAPPRLQSPHPPGRHRRRDAGAHRVRRRDGRELDHGRRLPNIIDASFEALTDSSSTS
jgi:2-isopropylmalate synthase